MYFQTKYNMYFARMPFMFLQNPMTTRFRNPCKDLVDWCGFIDGSPKISISNNSLGVFHRKKHFFTFRFLLLLIPDVFVV